MMRDLAGSPFRFLAAGSGPRRWFALVVVAALAAGVLLPDLLGGSVAHAAEGPAPAPHEYRVLGTEHSDTIATFWDDGDFTLGAKADVDGNLGVRFPADGILVHVNDLARYDSWPGAEFVAPTGSTVWLAPQTRKDGVVWPGFSTEYVPGGVLDGQITLTLDSVTGPGDVEVWTTDSFGGIQERLWSSDEDHKSFSRPIGTHMHANWAFTQPGTYQLTVTATATTVGGGTVTDTQTYTFVAGPLAEQVTTNTALHVEGESTVVEGTPIELHATVSPASVEGYVEFRNGATVLGHSEVTDGDAELETTVLGIGTHSITAHFVPKVANYATASASEAVTVTVTDEGGVPFSITGVQASYEVGDTLTATVVGYPLGDGQQYRWYWRPVGSSITGMTLQTSTALGYSRVIAAADHGFELSVAVLESGIVVAQSDWTPVSVGVNNPELSMLGDEFVFIAGDTFRLEASNLQLAEGETFQFVRKAATSGTTWSVTGAQYQYRFWFAYPEEHVLEVTRQSRTYDGTFAFAVRVLKDGQVVRQSAPVTVTSIQDPEIQISGLHELYFEGETAELEATVYPDRSGAGLEARWQFKKGSDFTGPVDSGTTWGVDDSIPASVVEELNAADHDGGYLRVVLTKPGWVDQSPNSAAGGGSSIVGISDSYRVFVTDDPDAQLFFLAALAGHYHQGDNVNLNLTVFPVPGEGDELQWQWRWPGADWAPFPGATGTSHTLTAEQAIDGVEVRVLLDYAEEGKESKATAPVTILEDDHGAAARQQPTITGTTSVTEGDAVILTRTLPLNGPTVLTTHRWERQAAGAEEWTVVEGETAAELSFAAAAADDGAQYRVSLIKPNGQLGYGPSPAVTLEVGAGGGPVATAPEAPAQPGATVDGSSVTVSWAAPADGGSPLTGYTVTLTPAEGDPLTQDAAADATSVTFTEVPAGTWTASVVATNEVGSSAASAASDPVAVTDPGPGGLSQTIVATLDESQGALVVSVDPDDRVVTMGPFALAVGGDRWESTGTLRPVTVTDTRSGAPGWVVSAQTSDFTTGGGSLAARYLGWLPRVLAQSAEQGVVPGGLVVPGFEAGDGLGVSAALGSAPAGAGRGSARLDADLHLVAPTATPPGTYQATLTLTVV